MNPRLYFVVFLAIAALPGCGAIKQLFAGDRVCVDPVRAQPPAKKQPAVVAALKPAVATAAKEQPKAAVPVPASDNKATASQLLAQIQKKLAAAKAATDREAKKALLVEALVFGKQLQTRKDTEAVQVFKSGPSKAALRLYKQLKASLEPAKQQQPAATPQPVPEVTPVVPGTSATVQAETATVEPAVRYPYVVHAETAVATAAEVVVEATQTPADTRAPQEQGEGAPVAPDETPVKEWLAITLIAVVCLAPLVGLAALLYAFCWMAGKVFGSKRKQQRPNPLTKEEPEQDVLQASLARHVATVPYQALCEVNRTTARQRRCAKGSLESLKAEQRVAEAWKQYWLFVANHCPCDDKAVQSLLVRLSKGRQHTLAA